MTVEQREKRNAQDRARRAANPEKLRAYYRAYRAANPEKARAYRVARRAANPEKLRVYFQNHHLVRTYGLTLKQVERRSAQRGHACAHCRHPFEGVRGKRSRVVDHCHVTGRWRGLLCNGCNGAFGALGDSPHALRRALSYLEASA